ncbi:amino acid permease [Leifsonia shinshuensis]|uniref:amino acid permease n=1 Tax=Leifsonia shinshuensis TaxID=150026 RepID=UPI001F50BA83|nr:amino acid permease [Leifsonia shinshuensis]MCI0157715.1 amino acid permease [Leifsonia shinshuensis]
MPTIAQQLLRRKPTTPPGAGEAHLKRSIGLFSLTMIGVGGTLGTGIFFILSQAVPVAGPAVIWSFVIGGVVAGLTALCYAEMAGAVPASGSTYSYAYATLGEGTAMAVGACLLLEYGVSTAAVAVGWSQYVNQLLQNLFGWQLPVQLSQAPEQGGIINIPAVIVIVLCSLLLVRGARESTTVNSIMVIVKIAVVLFFCAIAFTGWNSDHFHNFAPAGFAGIVGGAGIIFFSFVGLDAVSTAGEEAKNPKRNLPLAIIFALGIIIVLYVATSLAALGAQSPQKFANQDAGLAAILQNIVGSSWPGTVVAIGAIISIFSVTLVCLYGQTRILFAMSRDGMIPKVFAKVNARSMTPVRNTVIVMIATSVLAAVVPIDFLAEMTSIGTLVAFLVVSLGVIILRVREPELERGFRLPLGWTIPILSIAGCIAIITQLRPITIIVFLIWTAVFLVFYWFYGRKHSTLQTGSPAVEPEALYTSNFAQPSKSEIREAAERRKANRR